ncbi:hypothetical protein DPPLL_10130 [Desulfofustis limnaeus]|uniref:Prepilin-type N-terminal cleavage/methylation domain-containing protein n=1 Tax=Desulfofustis limnaeus TaxID=2740163 RepID=A0ABM7W6Y4_9BACT|nr:hypothetical protein DPPLL_10130 [Desulfofustis limnaeus]
MPGAPSQRAAGIVSRDGRCGFTLIELLVVLVLLSLVLAFTVPRFRATVLDDPLNSSVRLLVGLIREAKQRAPQSHRGCFLAIDMDGGRLDLVCRLPPDRRQPEAEAADGEDAQGEDTPLTSKTLPESVRVVSIHQREGEPVTSGIVRLWVNRQGLMEPAIINLRGDDETIGLTVSPFLPAVELADREIGPDDAGWRR